ncbi:hypothetical protein [Secundilactobacillus kimchicus]|uniref:hypothetical protein n=1 Tax=Secundilactobacillus kimchicus TaxID=528209 RepID=UPI0024A944FE|nr:hypothetical protein [Secundilactobacillus kimchicus]
MSEFKTMDDFYKDDHTVPVNPLTMEVFAPMLDKQPLEFTYKGTTFNIPLGEDVKLIFEGMVKLIHDNSKYMELTKDATTAEKLAFDYARRVGTVMQNDEEACKHGDKQQSDQS